MKKKLLITNIILILTGNIAFCQAPDVQWQGTYGGSGDDLPTTLIQTADGGYIIGGKTYSTDRDVAFNHGSGDAWLIKIDAFGILQWERTYGGSGDDSLASLKQTSDGGYIFAGETSSNDGDTNSNYGGADCWIVKLDADGNIQWQKNYGGTFNDSARSIQQTADGNYIFAGYTSSNDIDVAGNHNINGLDDFWVVKIDSVGILQWQKCFGGNGSDEANAVMETSDGKFIVVGETWSTNGDVVGNHNSWSGDAWVIKVDSSGELLWQKSLGGSYSDRAHSVVEATDGNYIIGASAQSNDGDVLHHHGVDTAYSDFWILALNPNGEIQWQNSLGGYADEFAAELQKTSDGGYVVAGFTTSSDGDVTSFNGASDYWITKLNSDGDLQWQLSLGGNNYEYAYAIKQSADGGYIVAGSVMIQAQGKIGDVDRGGSPSQSDYWVIKLSPDSLNTTSVVTDYNRVKVYPNPVYNTLTVDMMGEIANRAEVSIIDIAGKEIFKGKVNNPIYKINMDAYSNGLYFLKYSDENGEKAIKILKQ